MDQSNIPEPKMDALAATRMLENIFEESNVSANTVPASALADHQSLHRKKYFGLRVLLIIVMVIWLLVPILFLKPDFSLRTVMNSPNVIGLSVYITASPI